MEPASERGKGLPHGDPQPSLCAITVEVLEIAIPNVIGYLLTLVNEVTNTIFIGHVGSEEEQAAVGLAIMMQNCVAINTAFGLLGALDTLVSQNYGAGRYELCCVHLQRGRAVTAVQLLWMAPLLWFSQPVLELLQQDAKISAHAAAYNRATLPGLVCYFQFEATRKFLINFGGDVRWPAAMTAAASLLHVGWSAYFVLHLRMGNAGAGFANVITWVTQCAALSAYVFWRAPRLGLRRRAVLWVEPAGWSEWGAYLRLGVPAMLQLWCVRSRAARARPVLPHRRGSPCCAPMRPVAVHTCLRVPARRAARTRTSGTCARC